MERTTKVRDARLAPVRRSKRVVYAIGNLAWALIKRGYALALIAVVLGLSFKAFFYLVSALILPAKPPPQIADVQRRMDARVLTQSGAAFAGIRATQNPRGPLSHYHRFDPWYLPDQKNGCTLSGCHVALPHGRNKADRAFLNLHATSLHCGICHMQAGKEPLPLVWYDLKTGRTREIPASLRAYGWLTESRIEKASVFTERDQQEIASLLRAAAQEAEGNPALLNLAQHLSAVRVQSAEFARLVGVARETLPRHFRGEYGAKLALIDGLTGAPRLGKTADEEALQAFLANRAVISEEEKVVLLKRIHPEQRNPTLQCKQCHQPEGALVDLAALGYPPARIEAIVRPLVMQTIQHITEGRPFHIPSLFELPGTQDFDFFKPRGEKAPDQMEADHPDPERGIPDLSSP